jgi:hypothetical protein
MDRPPTFVSAARLLILLNALVWLTFAAIIAVGAHPALPDSALLRWVMAILGLLTCVALLVLYVFLGRRSRLAFLAALTALTVLAALSIADQVGLADLAVLALQLAALACLIGGRGWFMAGGASTPDANRGA